MKATLMLYIVMGALFIVPLVLFNVRKIWVRKPPEPVKFKWGRFTFIVLFSAFIVFFLVCAYRSTLANRYEIPTEQIATKHAEMLTGRITKEEFRQFVIDNGTENVAASFDATDFSALPAAEEAKFQFSSWYVPRYWEDEEGFEGVEVIDEENPAYLQYLMQIGEQRAYYVIRLRRTEDGWKYDWIGNATEAHSDIIKMPSEINGKWYTVTS